MNSEQELAALQKQLKKIKAKTAEKKKPLKAAEPKRRELINKRVRRTRYRITAAERNEPAS